MKLNLSSPWHLIVANMMNGTVQRALDLLWVAYNTTNLANPDVCLLRAHVAMLDDSSKAMLYLRHAIEFYKKEQKWGAMSAVAQDLLYFNDLRFFALTALLEASMKINDPAYAAENAMIVCWHHREHTLSTPQCLHIFFTALVPHHQQSQYEAVTTCILAVLEEYDVLLKSLLDAQIQSYLYARGFAVEQQIG